MNRPSLDQRAQDLLEAANQLTPAEQQPFLVQQCAGDELLLSRVLALAAVKEEPSENPTLNVSMGIVPTDKAVRQDVLSSKPPGTPDRIGNYEIIRKLGEGGMGTVYEARQQSPDRRVAIKVVATRLHSESTRDRFRYETQVLGLLQHPGIAQIYESSDSDHQPFFAMELVEGLPLTDYAIDRKLNQAQRLSLVAEICEAIHHAHQKGVVHRDLKPGNIFVTEEGQPKILDFGIARAVAADDGDCRNTLTGQVVGTVAYMSPEQASGGELDIDARSDIYSIGVVLFELLSGQLPYDVQDESLIRALEAIRHRQPPRLGSLTPAARGDVETIVGKSLSKNREDRYSSAAEMAEDIRRFLRHEPITAHPPSVFYELSRFVRRNRLGVGLATLMLLSLVGGVIGTSLAMFRANNEWRRAESNADRANAAAQQAIEESEEKQAIFEFLVLDMLGAANPSLRSHDVKVVEVLDDAAGTIDGRFADRPQIAAVTHDTVGQSYLALGRPKQARSHFQQAQELWTQLGKQNSREGIATTVHLGNSYDEEGEFDKAEASLRQALHRAESHLGPDDRLTAIAMTLLGETLQTTGRHDEAQDLLTRSIGIQSAQLGNEHPEVLSSLNNLAASYQAEGNLEQAEKLILQVYAARQATLSATSPELLGSMNQLAGLYYERGDFAKAAPFFEKIIKVLPQVLPEHHPAFARYHGNYGACLGKLGQMEVAEEHVLLAYQINNDSLGPDHESTLFYLKNVHGFYWAWGKVDKAEKYHRIFIRSILRTADHDKSGRDAADYWIDQLELKLRKFDRQLDRDALYRELIAHAEQQLAAGQPLRARYLGNLGSLLFDAGEFKLAEMSLRQCYDERVVNPGIDHPETRWTGEKLIEVYMATGQEVQAAELRKSLGKPQQTGS